MRMCLKCLTHLRPGVTVCPRCGQAKGEAEENLRETLPAHMATPSRAELDEIFGPDPLQEATRPPRPLLREGGAWSYGRRGFKAGVLFIVAIGFLQLFNSQEPFSERMILLAILIVFSLPIGICVGVVATCVKIFFEEHADARHEVEPPPPSDRGPEKLNLPPLSWGRRAISSWGDVGSDPDSNIQEYKPDGVNDVRPKES